MTRDLPDGAGVCQVELVRRCPSQEAEGPCPRHLVFQERAHFQGGASYHQTEKGDHLLGVDLQGAKGRESAHHGPWHIKRGLSARKQFGRSGTSSHGGLQGRCRGRGRDEDSS